MALKLQLANTPAGTAGRSDLEAAYKAKCMEPVPVPPPTVNCDELRKKLAAMDSGSADYASLVATLKAHCPEKPPVPDTTKIPPKPPVQDSICMALKLQLANTPAGTAGRSVRIWKRLTRPSAWNL